MVCFVDYNCSMIEVPISVFKAQCLALLEEVRRTRKPLRITRHGKPVAEIIPASKPLSRKEWFDSMKGSVQVLGDIVSPAGDESDWEISLD
jgi:prevent-host-death family protein